MKRPDKPAIALGAASVTLPYGELAMLLRYVDQLENCLAFLDSEERREAQTATAAAVSADPGTYAALLHACAEVASFVVAYHHPAKADGSKLPANALRRLARSMIEFFGDGAQEAVRAKTFLDHADSVDEHNRFRDGLRVSMASPCERCGCASEAHAPDPGDVLESGLPGVKGTRRTGDPTLRLACSRNGVDGHADCQRFVPSVPLPPLPAL